VTSPKLVDAAHHYPLIREFSTTSDGEFIIAGRQQQFRNTNTLVKSPTWDIGLSKTGYINEAGKMPGNASVVQQQADHHRAARFLGQADPHRRRQPHQALGGECIAGKAERRLIAAVFVSRPPAGGFFVHEGPGRDHIDPAGTWRLPPQPCPERPAGC
jgi:hypothetical protein